MQLPLEVLRCLDAADRARPSATGVHEHVHVHVHVAAEALVPSELALVVQPQSRLVLERPPVSAVLPTLPVDR